MDAIARIPVHPGQWALVDRADAEKVEEYRWYAYPQRNGHMYVQAYVRENGKHTTIQLARLITGLRERTHLVTFKNENPLDCRRENLKVVEPSYTSRHGRKMMKATSRYRGVRLGKEPRYRYKWRAMLRTGGRWISLGRFATEEEAARAYDVAALRYFGASARLNLPDRVGEPVPTTFHTITCVVCGKRVSTNQPRQKYCEGRGPCEWKAAYMQRKQRQRLHTRFDSSA